MKLINAEHFDERVRIAGGFAEEELSEDFKEGVLTVLEMLKTEPEIDAVPIGCLKLEKADCGFSIQTDMGGSYERERERACKNIMEWYTSPSYKRCLAVAEQRGFIG